MIGIGNMIGNQIGASKFKGGLPKITSGGEEMEPKSLATALDIKDEVDSAMITFRKADNSKKDLNPEKGKVTGTVEEGYHYLTGTLEYNPETEKPKDFNSTLYNFEGKFEYHDKGNTVEYGRLTDEFMADRQGKTWKMPRKDKFTIDKATGTITEMSEFPFHSGNFTIDENGHARLISNKSTGHNNINKKISDNQANSNKPTMPANSKNRFLPI